MSEHDPRTVPDPKAHAWNTAAYFLGLALGVAVFATAGLTFHVLASLSGAVTIFVVEFLIGAVLLVMAFRVRKPALLMGFVTAMGVLCMLCGGFCGLMNQLS